MLTIGLEVRVDVFTRPEQIVRTLELELNSATIPEQIDGFLASLTDDIREKLTESAEFLWGVNRMMGEDVN